MRKRGVPTERDRLPLAPPGGSYGSGGKRVDPELRDHLINKRAIVRKVRDAEKFRMQATLFELMYDCEAKTWCWYRNRKRSIGSWRQVDLPVTVDRTDLSNSLRLANPRFLITCYESMNLLTQLGMSFYLAKETIEVTLPQTVIQWLTRRIPTKKIYIFSLVVNTHEMKLQKELKGRGGGGEEETEEDVVDTDGSGGDRPSIAEDDENDADADPPEEESDYHEVSSSGEEEGSLATLYSQAAIEEVTYRLDTSKK